MKSAVTIIFISIFVAGCSSSVTTQKNHSTIPPNNLFKLDSIKWNPTNWVDSTMQHLSLREKIGQMFVVFTPTPYFANDSRRLQELEHFVKDSKVGGLYFSTGDIYNFPILANKLQRIADTPLMISVDFEWGAGMRIDQATTFPRFMAVAATRDTSLAYQMGLAIAEEARALGVHQNYSPDVDVNNNPKNPVINTRSFGEDPKLVSDFARAFIRGTEDGNLIATAKHFPGHGDTDKDTHLDIPSMHFSRERFDSVELVPFKSAIAAGVQSVMVGHIHAQAFDESDSMPATVSEHVVTNLLKNELGFKGLIVTDAMAMKGLTKLFEPGEAAVRSIKAGVDMILMSPNTDEAIGSIVEAVGLGEISVARINQSVEKILRYKQALGLPHQRFVDIDSVSSVVGINRHRELAQEIARKSITVLGNDSGILPLRNLNGKRILCVVFADEEAPDYNYDLYKELRSRNKMDVTIIDPRSNQMEYEEMLMKVKRSDLVITQFNFQIRSGMMSGFLPKKISDAVKEIVKMKKPVIGISTGNPYIVSDFPVLDAFVQLYSSSAVSEESAAEVIFGEYPAKGKLPITIPGKYNFGDGATYQSLYVHIGKPIEAGFDAAKLAKVDTIITHAIADSAFPGAVCLIAKDGIIVHEKAYGKFTYDSFAPPVTTDDLFDLASVTKVIATTTAIMRLVDEKKVSLNDSVVKYFPSFGQHGKEKITLYNLMVHNSGLPAWRKFYEFCDSPQCVLDSIFATPLIYKTGDSTLYSDLGLITIGRVIEKVTGTTLDRYVDSVFFKPLGMTTTMYNPPKELLNRIIPTEVDSFWKKTGLPVHGRVHDENAATLGGVSGHAGLFSTAHDLVKLLQMELNGGVYGGKRYLQEETIKKFTTRQSPKSTRGIGWDTRNGIDGFEGKYPSVKTFRHTGFTGTSVVVDPEKKLIVIFLTNRVYPTRENSKLFRVRPAVHNAIYEALK